MVIGEWSIGVGFSIEVTQDRWISSISFHRWPVLADVSASRPIRGRKKEAEHWAHLLVYGDPCLWLAKWGRLGPFLFPFSFRRRSLYTQFLSSRPPISGRSVSTTLGLHYSCGKPRELDFMVMASARTLFSCTLSSWTFVRALRVHYSYQFRVHHGNSTTRVGPPSLV